MNKGHFYSLALSICLLAFFVNLNLNRIKVLEDKVFSPPEPGADIAQIDAPAHNSFSSPSSSDPVPVSLAGPGRITFDDLLDAIEWIESKGDPWAVGDGGKAVGSFQIHEIYYNDVKRIQLKKFATYPWSACMFRLKDRYDPKKSREMVTIYLKHYGGTFEEMARKHVGGPNGHKKDCTKPYWEKVKARMEQK